MNSIFRQVGCSLNLFVNSSFPTCTTIQELRQIQSILRKMKNLSSSQFASETGCLFQCSKCFVARYIGCSSIAGIFKIYSDFCKTIMLQLPSFSTFSKSILLFARLQSCNFHHFQHFLIFTKFQYL